MLTAEQIVAAQKANIETIFGLTQKAFEGVEKLLELNVQATKAANLLTPLSDDQVKKLATSNDKLGTAILVGTGLAPGSVKALGFISRKQAIAMLEHGEYNGRYMDLSKRILLVPFTTPDDLPIMEKVAGIVVSKGGHTSHEIGR